MPRHFQMSPVLQVPWQKHWTLIFFYHGMDRDEPTSHEIVPHPPLKTALKSNSYDIDFICNETTDLCVEEYWVLLYVSICSCTNMWVTYLTSARGCQALLGAHSLFRWEIHSRGKRMCGHLVCSACDNLTAQKTKITGHLLVLLFLKS